VLKPRATAHETERDMAGDLLQSIDEMKAGKGRVVCPSALAARQETGLSHGGLGSSLLPETEGKNSDQAKG